MEVQTRSMRGQGWRKRCWGKNDGEMNERENLGTKVTGEGEAEG